MRTQVKTGRGIFGASGFESCDRSGDTGENVEARAALRLADSVFWLLIGATAIVHLLQIS